MKELLKKLTLEFFIQSIRNRIKKSEYKAWKQSGSPAPSHALAKQLELMKYKQKFNLEVLIETLTYYGVTIDTLKTNFKKLISIEISHELFQLTKKKFVKHDHIEIYEGDSGSLLPQILKNLNQKCLFCWMVIVQETKLEKAI